MSLAFRAATDADIDLILDLWAEGAENASRPPDTREAVTTLLHAAEDRFRVLGAARADAMVLDGNDLGQNLWRARGYHPQDDWRRWVKAL